MTDICDTFLSNFYIDFRFTNLINKGITNDDINNLHVSNFGLSNFLWSCPIKMYNLLLLP